jgi:hypothetical protein
LITSIWEINIYSPNNMAIKMSRCSIYSQK